MRFRYFVSSLAVLVAGVTTTAHAQAKPVQSAIKQPTSAANTAAKAADHKEHRAFGAAEKEPAALLHSVKLTKTEKTAVASVEKKYKEQIENYRKSHEAAEKAGTEDDSQVVSKVQAIVDQERTDLRAALSPAQQATFDKNAAKIKPL